MPQQSPGQDLIIAHLSDLHLTAGSSEERFDLVAEEIKTACPSFVFVTGDIVNSGNDSELEFAKKKLLGCVEKKWKGSRLLVVPGNHDVRIRGIFHRSNSKERFNFYFSDWNEAQLLEHPVRNVAVFCLDSNTGDDFKLNFARGKVGEAEYARFLGERSRLQEKWGDTYARSFKIVLVHHHPLPIPDTEVEEGIFKRYQEATLALDDAGKFLRLLIQNGIDLVLHGHKHCPSYARLTLLTHTGERELSVLGGGSTSNTRDPGPHGNAFNILHLKSDGTVFAKQYHWIGGGFASWREPQIVSYESQRCRLYDDSLRQASRRYESICHEVSINAVGDAKLRVRHVGCRVIRGPLHEVPIRAGTWEGGKCSLVDVISHTPKILNPLLRIDSESTEQRVSGAAILSSPLDASASPFEYEVKYSVFNGFAVTGEQYVRMYGTKGNEQKGVKIKHPVDRLLVLINFELPIPPNGYSLRVKDGNGRDNLREQAWASKGLYYSELTRTIVFEVVKPLEGHTYEIEWQLPYVEQAVKKYLPQRIQWDGEKIQRNLLALRPTDNESPKSDETIQDAIQRIRDAIAELLRDREERMECALLVFDETQKRLRIVAGLVPRSYFDSWSLFEGQGIAGRTHKTNQARVFVRELASAETDYYTSPPPGTPNHEVVLAIPIRYPIDREDVSETSKVVLGVFAVASRSKSSGLKTLYDDSEGMQSLREAIANHVHSVLIPACEKFAGLGY